MRDFFINIFARSTDIESIKTNFAECNKNSLSIGEFRNFVSRRHIYNSKRPEEQSRSLRPKAMWLYQRKGLSSHLPRISAWEFEIYNTPSGNLSCCASSGLVSAINQGLRTHFCTLFSANYWFYCIADIVGQFH